MKINLLLDNAAGVQGDFLNIDPFAPENDPAGRVNCDVTNFDAHCDNSEATEIIASGVLSYFPQKEVDGILNYWLGKLRHGGKLTIVEPDLYDIVTATQSRALSIDEANTLLYGEQREPWQFRRCMLTVNKMADVLRSKGLQIIKKRVNAFLFVVEAQRP